MKKTMLCAIAGILTRFRTLLKLATGIHPLVSVLISGTSISCGGSSGGKFFFTPEISAARFMDQASKACAEAEECDDSAWKKVGSISQYYRYHAKPHGIVLDYTGVAGKEYRAAATYAKTEIINASHPRVGSFISAIS